MVERSAVMREYRSRVTPEGQVTLPAEVRRVLGVPPRAHVTFVVEADQVRLAPATGVAARTAGALKSDVPALSPREEKAAAEEAMAEEATQEGR
jgi:bifunctional DNA-binding transcriptional regulator/antitoxin component of YhaV-PrlF toxin-antitoxin module